MTECELQVLDMVIVTAASAIIISVAICAMIALGVSLYQIWKDRRG